MKVSTRKVKYILCLLFATLFFVCIGSAFLVLPDEAKSVNALTTEEQSTIISEYVSPIGEENYLGEYVALEPSFATEEGYDVAKRDGSTLSMNGALNGANAVRFQWENVTACNWETIFGLFTTNQGVTYLPSTAVSISIRSNTIYLVKGSGGPDKALAAVSANVGIRDVGSKHNVELGGIPVYSKATDEQVGRYFYLDLNGVRILEYFENTVVDYSAGTYFTVNSSRAAAANGNAKVYSYSATDISDKVAVDVSQRDANGKPVPVVYYKDTAYGITSMQIVDDSLYTVSYTASATLGKGIASIAFVDKYTGSVTVEYDGFKDSHDAAAQAIVNSYISPVGNDNYIGEYKVLEPYTNIEGTNVGIRDTSTMMANDDLKGANAIRFQWENVTACNWETIFGLFTTNQGVTYLPSTAVSVSIRSNTIYLVKGSAGSDKALVSASVNVGIREAGSKHNVEFGGIPVYSKATNEQVGRYFYFELNGVRILEYFENTVVDYTAGTYFTVNSTRGGNAATGGARVYPYATQDVAGKVAIDISEKDAAGKPIPKVYYRETAFGFTKTQVIDASSYKVSYREADAAGKGVVSIDFTGGKFNAETIERVYDGYGISHGFVSPIGEDNYFGEYTVLEPSYATAEGYDVPKRDSATLSVNGELNGASAVRFQWENVTACNWETIFGLFTTNQGVTYLPSTAVSVGIRSNMIYLVKGSAGPDNALAKVSTNVGIRDAGSKHNVEFGGIPVYNKATNEQVGRYFYFELNGVRMLEYFEETVVDYSAGTYFTVNSSRASAANGDAKMYPYAMQDISDKITIDINLKDENGNPIPQIFYEDTYAGITYRQLLDSNLYSVSYRPGEEGGTGVMSIDFEGGEYTKYYANIDDIIYDGFKAESDSEIIDSYISPVGNDNYIGEYKVLEPYTNIEGTNVGIRDTNTMMANGELNGANAVRFQWENVTACNWETIFGLFTTNQGVTYLPGTAVSVSIRSNTIYLVKGSAGPDKALVSASVNVGIREAGSKHNVEFGGIPVYSKATNEQVGRYFYFELNGVRILEYFENTVVDYTAGTYFTVNSSRGGNAATGGARVYPYAAQDIAGKVTVDVSGVDEAGLPIPVVYYTDTAYGITSTQIISENDYKVTYSAWGDADNSLITIDFANGQNKKFTGVIYATCDKFYEITIVDGDTERKEYGTSHVLADLTTDDNSFLGWEMDGVLYPAGYEIDLAESSGRLTAKYVDFYMLGKAAIKVSGGEDGIRYETHIASEDVEMLAGLNGITIQYGSRVSNGIKSFEKYITDWFKDDCVVDGKTVDIFTTLLMNFDASNLETQFIVTAYMDITFSTENGDTTIRVWAVGETVRSVKQVAELALMDYKETSGGDYTYAVQGNDGKVVYYPFTKAQIEYMENITGIPVGVNYLGSTEEVAMFAFYGPGNGYYQNGNPMGDGTDMRTKERYQEYRDCGFNVLLLENEARYNGEDWETSKLKEIMDIAQEVGLKVIVFDYRLYELTYPGNLIGKTYKGVTFNSQSDINALVATYMQDYKSHPAYYGLHVIDEPTTTQIDSFFQVYIAAKTCAPQSYVHSCLIADTAVSEQVWEYVLENDLDTVALDTYAWRYRFATEKTEVLKTWLESLQNLANKCAQNGVDYSFTSIGCFGDHAQSSYPDGYTTGWAVPTDDELRWSVYASLAFAPKKMGWYYYWETRYNPTETAKNTGIMGANGEKLRYDIAQQLNNEVQLFMKAMMNFEFRGVHYYTDSLLFPEYYPVLMSSSTQYNPVGITCTGAVNETMISELYDEQRGNRGYFIMNTTVPSNKETSKLTVNFEGFDKLVVYNKGVPTVVNLVDGSYTFNLASAEGVFVIPFKAQ